jgi:adenylate cyclase
MSDIFISYSRKDSEQALSLAERLRGEGMSVWIDQQGIGAAEQWATEIASSIRECSSFILVLSPSSILSENVLKELSLASEKRKRIVPIDIAAGIEIPVSFEYALAGIQRVAYSDHSAIHTALAGGAMRKKSPADTRKSLMILPFDDLSPGADNGWFADGLASELIAAFSHFKSLRLIDWQTSKLVRSRVINTIDLARELDVRYFLQGSVRKFGDQLRITASILDINEGEYLWHLSERGTMDDIFELQDAVSAKIVEGLKLHLTTAEVTSLQSRETVSAEAYELKMKALQYYERYTREDYLRAIALYDEAIRLDPNYAVALAAESRTYSELYRNYDRNPEHLSRAEELVLHAHEIDPNLHTALALLSHVQRHRGNFEEAEKLALEYVEKAPDTWESHFELAFFYSVIGRSSDSVGAYERALQLRPEYLPAFVNIVFELVLLGDIEKTRRYSDHAIPIYEKHLRLNPDDEYMQVNYACILWSAGYLDKASEYIGHLQNVRDAGALFNLACLAIGLKDLPGALSFLHRSVQAGFSNIEQMRTDPDLDPLREFPEFNSLLTEVELAHV